MLLIRCQLLNYIRGIENKLKVSKLCSYEYNYLLDLVCCGLFSSIESYWRNLFAPKSNRAKCILNRSKRLVALMDKHKSTYFRSLQLRWFRSLIQKGNKIWILELIGVDTLQLKPRCVYHISSCSYKTSLHKVYVRACSIETAREYFSSRTQSEALNKLTLIRTTKLVVRAS